MVHRASELTRLFIYRAVSGYRRRYYRDFEASVQCVSCSFRVPANNFRETQRRNIKTLCFHKSIYKQKVSNRRATSALEREIETCRENISK